MSQEKECGCGCDHEREEEHECGCHGEGHECGCHDDGHDEEELIHLTLEDGTEWVCQVVGVFPVEDKEYIALLPNGKEDVYLYAYDEDEEGPILSEIEEDEEYEKVSKVFLELCDEE